MKTLTLESCPCTFKQGSREGLSKKVFGRKSGLICVGLWFLESMRHWGNMESWCLTTVHYWSKPFTTLMVAMDCSYNAGQTTTFLPRETYGYSLLKECYFVEYCRRLASTASRPAMYLGRCDHTAYITLVLCHISFWGRELKWLSRCLIYLSDKWHFRGRTKGWLDLWVGWSMMYSFNPHHWYSKSQLLLITSQ